MRGHSGGHAADLLVAALQARPGLSAVEVRREYPTADKDIKNPSGVYDAVWIGRESRQDITDISVDWSFGSAAPHVSDETYTLWLTIQCLRNTSSGTQKIATDRAVDILGEVLATIAANPSLGFVDSSDLSTFWCRGMNNLLKTGQLDQGHGAGFEVGLRFQCRLHLS